MKHIRQINSVGTDSYTIIDTTDWMGQIDEHPSVVEHPEWFEISEEPIPEQHQYLIYES